jgi:GNAT superfamily N-acetyltransferase
MKILQAKSADKALVIELLSQAFAQDPHMRYIVGGHKGFSKRLGTLLNYAFEHSMANGAITLTENKQAVAIWRNFGSNKMSFGLAMASLRFMIDFGYEGMKRVHLMEKEVQQAYPKQQSFWYLWLLGTHPSAQGQGLASALLQTKIAECAQTQTAVYLETSTESNVTYYSKKGFEVYEKLNFGQEPSVQVSLMKLSI